MQDIIIRNLRPDELNNWLDFLCREIFPNDPRDAVESLWRDDSQKDFGGIFVAVNPNGAIVGSAKAGCRMLPLAGESVPAGIISGVGIRKEFRRQGLATQLMTTLHDSLRRRKMAVAHLYSKPDTFAFYQNLGYRALPQQPDEDFFRMYRVLIPFTLNNMPVKSTEQLISRLS